ncbi:hypothetical protein [Caulobacter endophyticus]|uniref:Uncharacterized protein n=1 Tax=Caulobacter endophyticus TaxID=2172652 RepID=A0A2T9KCW5_9CAUL|nr:hypothetical protein [Caulobacter endophyticus]PVM93739.1 hypothetical protein DDF67_02160 [Caulobacter endophyticus]
MKTIASSAISRRALLVAGAALPTTASAFARMATEQPAQVPPPIAVGPTVRSGPEPETNLIPLKPGERLPEQYRLIDPVTGEQKGYAVLPAEERAKGFVRPVRRTYTHLTCGKNTSMALAIAETFARAPKIYRTTFCSTCKTHLPVSEFVWLGTQEPVGS